MILSNLKNVKFSHSEGCSAYYKDENGRCWYDFRNKILVPNKPIIVVDESTKRVILFYNGDDPSRVGLFLDKTVSIYQLDSVKEQTWEEFYSKHYSFINNELVSTVIGKPKRSKEEILADLDRLREELMATKE